MEYFFNYSTYLFGTCNAKGSFPAVVFKAKLRIFSDRGSWITECCLSGCWTTRPPPNLKAAVQLQTARTPLKAMIESG